MLDFIPTALGLLTQDHGIITILLVIIMGLLFVIKFLVQQFNANNDAFIQCLQDHREKSEQTLATIRQDRDQDAERYNALILTVLGMLKGYQNGQR